MEVLIIESAPGFRKFRIAGPARAIVKYWIVGRARRIPELFVDIPIRTYWLFYGPLAAPEDIIGFWKEVAKKVKETMGPANIWLSTSGLGVYWLHVRLDTRPKYYQYAPYRAS